MVAEPVKKKSGPRKRHAGMFQKGVSGNPKGKPPGYQDFVTRARYLIENYTAWQILEIVRNPNEKGWKIPVRDLMIMMQIADGLTKDGGAKAERLLDRILGKPTETHNINQTVDATVSEHFTIQEIDRWIKDITGDATEGNPPPSLPN